MERKIKGRLAEAKVIAYFIENGYEVYIPFSNNSKYDLLVSKENRIHNISVKYTSTKRYTDSWTVDLRQISRRKDYINIEKFNHSLFDFLAIYIGPKDKVVLIEVSKLKTRSVDIRI
jgi:hypothetical protein